MFLLSVINKLPVPRMARFTAVVAVAMAAGHLAQTMAAHQLRAVPVVLDEKAMPTHIVQLSSGGADEVAMTAPDPATVVTAPCPVELSLKALPQAMLSVALTAPCHQGERVVLHQAGLAVTGRVDADGTLLATLPALAAEAAVMVLFADGSRVNESLAMPDVATIKRFGVQWQGPEAFVLHGMENGADFGQHGDISRQHPVGAGFLTVLGDATVDNPLLAQVYTYPADASVKSDIVLEAAVLPATCGHDLLGDVLTSRSGQAQTTDLTLAMPDCSGVGDFLVLKNLATDTKIAAN